MPALVGAILSFGLIIVSTLNTALSTGFNDKADACGTPE